LLIVAILLSAHSFPSLHSSPPGTHALASVKALLPICQTTPAMLPCSMLLLLLLLLLLLSPPAHGLWRPTPASAIEAAPPG
jgi:hypothetical protein